MITTKIFSTSEILLRLKSLSALMASKILSKEHMAKSSGLKEALEGRQKTLSDDIHGQVRLIYKSILSRFSDVRPRF
jgi:hypothetical protein